MYANFIFEKAWFSGKGRLRTIEVQKIVISYVRLDRSYIVGDWDGDYMIDVQYT